MKDSFETTLQRIPSPLQPSMLVDVVHRHLRVTPADVVATALWRLWNDLKFKSSPLIFFGESYCLPRHHIPLLLDMMVATEGQQGEGKLVSWDRLPSPHLAHGAAATLLIGSLRRSNLIMPASIYDRNTVAGPTAGWYRYNFRGWGALSVLLFPDGDRDSLTITAIPQGYEDQWLEFLESLAIIHDQKLHEDCKGQIEVMGERDGDVEEAIKRCSLDDVILPDDILQIVAAQRRIFTPSMLERYASYGRPRIRKVLLAGPPGTGKTTLLKAEAARHAAGGGYVMYVFAAKKADKSWELLTHAMESAASCALPTLILVEDFDQFVGAAEDFQRVLNTLDGVATPDNPAGTLILATTNVPELIDPRIKDRPGRIDVTVEVGLVGTSDLVIRFLRRFLNDGYSEEEHAPFASELVGQAGSHIQEVCILGIIHALEEERQEVLRSDLQWAHETILQGRAVSAEPERCAPPPLKRRGSAGFRASR